MSNKLINRIETVINNAVDAIYNGLFNIEILYKYDDDKYHTVIAFKICTELNITPSKTADMIVNNIEKQPGIVFKNDNGYINIYLDNEVLDNEIEDMSKTLIQIPEFNNAMPFLMSYMINKIKTGIKYLWTINMNIDESVKKIALLIILLDSKNNKSDSELEILTERIYEYDRSLAGIKAPVSLYKSYIKALLPN